MRTQEPGQLMSRVCIDVRNAHVRTHRGNAVILVATDAFTKWSEAYAIPDHQATMVAKKLVEELFLRFGIPSRINSNQGAEFESNLFIAICKLLNVKKTRTTTYNPPGNGEVERINRMLVTLIKAFIDQMKGQDWDEWLPYVMAAFRSSVHESLRMTP